MPNINTLSSFPCTGCSTCYSLCGRKAISIAEDATGFYVALVDEDNCIDCGMCIAACARFMENFIGEELEDGVVYALRSANPDHVAQGSSGGFAHELAQMVIEKGGKAVGAEYDPATNRVEHRVIDQVDQLWRIDGTKYLQSETSQAFRQVLKDARRNKEARYVLFGTPCQIQGFSDACYLHPGSRERILLVEVFCQGVAGYRLWDEESKAIRQKLGTDAPFEKINFRSKVAGWNDFCLQVEADGKTYVSAEEDDLFNKAFFERALLREACMQCRQHGFTSTADIRIGDYWNKRENAETEGITAVVVLTDAGATAVEELVATGAVEALDAGSIDDVLERQELAHYTVKQQAMHHEAMRVLREGGSVQEAIAAYEKLKEFWQES